MSKWEIKMSESEVVCTFLTQSNYMYTKSEISKLQNKTKICVSVDTLVINNKRVCNVVNCGEIV